MLIDKKGNLSIQYTSFIDGVGYYKNEADIFSEDIKIEGVKLVGEGERTGIMGKTRNPKRSYLDKKGDTHETFKGALEASGHILVGQDNE